MTSQSTVALQGLQQRTSHGWQRAQLWYAKHGAQLPPWVNLALAIAATWMFTQLLWALVPVPEVARWKPAPYQAAAQPVVNLSNAGEQIAQAHLFGEAQTVAAAQNSSIANAPDTALNFTLLGILAGTRPAESLALIAQNGSAEAPYRLGDDITPGVSLQAIFPDRVILSRNGQLETLRLDKDAPSNADFLNALEGRSAPAPSGGGNLAEVRDTVLNDPNTAANFVRVQPVQTGSGGLRGFRVYPGASRDAFDSSGLQPGDVVTAINGQLLDNQERAMELLQSLSQANSASLAVDRNGEINTINVNVQP